VKFLRSTSWLNCVRALLLIPPAVPALCAAPSARAEDCTLQKRASIKIEAMPGEAPVVLVKLNDTERRFVVDTGSPDSGVALRVSQELQLFPQEIRGSEFYTNGKEIDRYVIVKSLQLGQMPASRKILLLMPPDILPLGVDGLLGADWLTNFDLDFDFGKRDLNLMSPKHCKGRVVYWTADYTTVPFVLSESRHLVIPVMLDGKRVSAAIDTGSVKTFISESSVSRAFGLTEKSPGAEPPPGAYAAGSWKFKYRFESLSFEGVTVKHPLLYVRADDDERTFSRKHVDKTQFDPVTRVDLEHQDVVVGMDVLRSLHVYVCYDEHMLYISAADAH